MTGAEKHGAGDPGKHTVFIGVIKTDVLEVSHFTETPGLTAFQPLSCVLNW